MSQKNKLLEAPPFAVADALKHFGNNLRTARLRRNLTIQQVAKKAGTGSRVISDAEKGKFTTGIGNYVALLWVYDLLEPFNEVADPVKDEIGQHLALVRDRERARHRDEGLDNDF
ncbi:MAG TPA: helix-turn-helix transcriptional regulator [Gammaproteobacteria bacterium]|jgi:transcriptional regulator with XRE-family HTH domain|nr:helix-turn-helix transcriptional regulator [Gammaproteobacteria bacterium]